MIPARERIVRPKVDQPGQKLYPRQQTKNADTGYSLKSNKKGYLIPATTKVQCPMKVSKTIGCHDYHGNQGIRVEPCSTAAKKLGNDGIRVTPLTGGSTNKSRLATSAPIGQYQLKGRDGRLVPTASTTRQSNNVNTTNQRKGRDSKFVSTVHPR